MVRDGVWNVNPRAGIGGFERHGHPGSIGTGGRQVLTARPVGQDIENERGETRPPGPVGIAINGQRAVGRRPLLDQVHSQYDVLETLAGGDRQQVPGVGIDQHRPPAGHDQRRGANHLLDLVDVHPLHQAVRHGGVENLGQRDGGSGLPASARGNAADEKRVGTRHFFRPAAIVDHEVPDAQLDLVLVSLGLEKIGIFHADFRNFA